MRKGYNKKNSHLTFYLTIKIEDTLAFMFHKNVFKKICYY